MSLDGVPLFPEGRAVSGGAFLLRGSSPVAARREVEGWVVSIESGRRFVIATGGSDETYTTARDAGRAMANKGLDLWSARGVADLSIVDVEKEHIAWWVDGGRTTLRTHAMAMLNIDVGAVNVVVTDGSGNVVRREIAEPSWHPAFRYFRLSQVSDDLVDSYRNLYLALESILDLIEPKRNENEVAWLRRALTRAGTVLELTSAVPAGTADPVSWLIEDLYLSKRNALFHAKPSRGFTLPHDAAERAMLIASHERLAHLVLRLAENALESRRPGGGIFSSFFRRQHDLTQARLGIVRTADPVDGDQRADEIPGVTWLATHAQDDERPFVVAALGTITDDGAVQIGRVAQILLAVGDDLYAGSRLEGELIVERIDRFEAQFALGARNVRQPRRDFTS